MKHLRQKAEAAQSAKLHRLGAMGSLKAARKGEHAPRKYASGGAVSDDMGPVDGMQAKGRLDRPGRSKMKGKKDAGKKGTNVNVIIMGKGGEGALAMPMAAPPDMPMPPPGPGGPPMPMRKSGGRVMMKHRAKRAEGGWIGEGDSGRPLKERAAAATKDADDAASSAKWHAGAGAASTGFAGLSATVPRSKGLTLANLGAAAFNGLIAAGHAKHASSKRQEADEANRAGDEAEGHKRGGRVNRRKC